MNEKFPCKMICKYKEITKYIQRAEKLLEAGEEWEEIEK